MVLKVERGQHQSVRQYASPCSKLSGGNYTGAGWANYGAHHPSGTVSVVSRTSTLLVAVTTLWIFNRISLQLVKTDTELLHCKGGRV